MSFDQILGQDQPKQIIGSALQNNSIPHAWLFYGQESIGKKLTAIELAKALNCPVSGPLDGCDTCTSCRKIQDRIHPDFFIAEPVKSSPGAREAVLKIDQIRELQKKLGFLPYEGKTKVAIVDSAESMNLQAANSFLKTLEEPPSSTVIILIAANPYQLLPTMVSRCQAVAFHPLPADVVRVVVLEEARKNNRDLAPEELDLRAQRSMGRIDRALEDDLIQAAGQRQGLLDLISELSYDRLDLLFQWTKITARQTAQVQNLLDEMQNLLRDLAVLKTGGPNPPLHNKDLARKLKPLAEKKPLPALLSMFDAVSRTKNALNGNANVQLSLETMLLNFCDAA